MPHAVAQGPLHAGDNLHPLPARHEILDAALDAAVLGSCVGIPSAASGGGWEDLLVASVNRYA